MEKTKGIVLNALRYSDSQLIVHIYTQRYGSITCMVRQSRSRRSGQSSMWQILTLLEFDIDFKPQKQFQTIREIQIHKPWTSIPYHPVKTTLAMFLGEFIHNALKHEGENDALFQFIENSLYWLDEATGPLGNFHIVMLMGMTRFLGFWPNVEDSTPRVYFDLQNACYTSVVPAHGQYLEGDEVRLMPLLLKMNYLQMRRVHLSRDERWHILEIITVYYRLHVPEFGQIRSMEVLRAIHHHS